MNTKTGSRRLKAFTLVELLVVIAIIGVLVGLLLPAVQAAREAVRRSACANKVRQMALGMQGYHDANQTFPFGYRTPIDWWVFTDRSVGPWNNSKTRSNDKRTWMIMISPFTEMNQVYDSVMTAVNPTASTLPTSAMTGLGVAKTKHGLYMCPSDTNAGKIAWSRDNTTNTAYLRGFCGNYLAAAASTTFGGVGSGPTLDGLIRPGGTVKISEVIDGLSKTVMLAEGVVVPNVYGDTFDARGGYFYGCHAGGTLFSTRYQPNTSIGDKVSNHTSWPPKAPTTSGDYQNYARSWHAGGVNVAMADASTRFVIDTVNAAVWTAAGSRNGSETLPALD